jgi:hypothetical protein
LNACSTVISLENSATVAIILSDRDATPPVAPFDRLRVTATGSG